MFYSILTSMGSVLDQSTVCGIGKFLFPFFCKHLRVVSRMETSVNHQAHASWIHSGWRGFGLAVVGVGLDWLHSAWVWIGCGWVGFGFGLAVGKSWWIRFGWLGFGLAASACV